MSYVLEKLSGNKIKLTFTIAAETFDEAVQRAYLSKRGTINVHGFRKGKAPRKLIETIYGEGVFYEDAFESLFPAAYAEALKQENISPVDRPSVDTQQIGAGKDLLFTAEVFVKPAVILGEYKGINVEKHLHEVTDEAIDARISQDVERASSTVEVTDRGIQEGDTVRLDYAGTVDGAAFEGGTAKDHSLVIGGITFIPGFEEQMVGMTAGEEKDLSVTFPENYHAEELKGKAAVFHVKVNEIRLKIKPALDDDFAADASSFDTFAEYRADIVRELSEQAAKEADSHLENDLIQKAVDASDCDIPQPMIEDETDTMIRELKMRMSVRGLRYEDYLKYTGQTEEQLREMYKAEAQNRVKTQLVIEAVAVSEGITATQEEIDRLVDEQAVHLGKDAAEYKATLNDNQKAYYADTAVVHKTIDFIKGAAVVSLCAHDVAHGHDA
jgi:trigger factor